MSEKSTNILALLSSLLFLPVGFILFLTWFSDTSEKRRLGKQCFMLSTLPYMILLVIGIINIYTSSGSLYR